MTLKKPSIKAVKDKYKSDWLKLPQVRSVGLCLDDSGEQVIVIGVETLNAAMGSNYPDSAEGYKVIVKEVGKPQAF